jgi:hypothetical protein
MNTDDERLAENEEEGHLCQQVHQEGVESVFREQVPEAW